MWLLYIIGIYLFLLCLMYLAQDRMMFLATGRTPAPAYFGLHDFEETTLTASDGVKLTAWFHAGQPGGKALIYFYGNADALPGYSSFFRRFADEGYSVLGVNYRGYGGSEGKPNEQGVYRDGRAAVQFMQQHTQVGNIIVAGRSLGSGVAVQLASEFKLGGLVLISPFTSTVDIASKLYWYVPVKWLMRNKFLSHEKFDKVQAPVLIIHGDRDTLVPLSHAQALLPLIQSRHQLNIYQGADHIQLDTERMAADILSFFKAH